MMPWRTKPSESSLLLATAALRIRDDFSGRIPAGHVEVELEFDLDGEWRPAKRRLVRTPGGVAYFPNLGRSAHPLDTPTRRYRVRVSWSFGRPLYEGGYPSNLDGAVFEVAPWNEERRPATVPAPHKVFLLPGPAYPFPPEVHVFRGRVCDASGAPIEDALVELGSQEKVLSDARGEFALPLRWVASGPVEIDFRDRHGRTATQNLIVPDDLGVGHEITIA